MVYTFLKDRLAVAQRNSQRASRSPSPLPASVATQVGSQQYQQQQQQQQQQHYQQQQQQQGVVQQAHHIPVVSAAQQRQSAGILNEPVNEINHANHMQID